MIVICLGIFLLMLFILSIIPSTLLSPKECIFWVSGSAFNLIFIFEILLIIAVPIFIQGLRVKHKDTYYENFMKFIKKHLLLIIIGIIIFIYTVVIDTTFITQDKMN